MAEGNSAAGKVSSPDHINVSSKKVFGGARKSATRNACAMETHLEDCSSRAPKDLALQIPRNVTPFFCIACAVNLREWFAASLLSAHEVFQFCQGNGFQRYFKQSSSRTL